MTEQQYRVVADRDKGDDIRKRFVRGDRVTFGSDADGGTVPVRIERLVPTADEPKYPAGFWATHVEDPVTGAITNEDGSPYVTPSPHPPTREQIAEEVTGIVIGSGYYSTSIHHDEALEVADAVLALLRKGGERA